MIMQGHFPKGKKIYKIQSEYSLLPANCKSMNGPQFNFFWIYAFDINNLKSIGKVRTLAKPLSKKRLEVILDEKLASLVKISDKEEESFADVDDECSFL